MKKTDPDYHRFYGNDGRWENTLHPEERDEHPTVNFFTIHHQSPVVATTESYHCYVNHIRGFHGKGFVACARFTLSPGASMWNSDIFYGTSEEVYRNAELRGIEMMNKMQSDLDKEMENHRIAWEEHLREEAEKTPAEPETSPATPEQF